MSKWAGTLSTTEPYNHLSVMQVRQGNENSEIFDFKVVRNSVPYDLTCARVLFCTKFKPHILVEKEATVLKPKEGLFQFVMDDDCMQRVGDQEGYFEIYEDGVLLDTTQNFVYTIQSSILKMEMNGESYIQRLEDLLNQLNDSFANGNAEFEKELEYWRQYVADNKELLESIDPGGALLNRINELQKQQEELNGTLQTNAALQIGGETPRPVFSSALNLLRQKIDRTKFNVLHMTDIHTDYGHGRTSWKYADMFWSHITNMQSLQDLADVAIYNGDNADCYIKDKDISEQQQRKFGIKAIRSAAIPTFVNLGNHDNGSPPFKRDIGKVMPGDIITNEEFKDFYETKTKLFDEVRNGDSLYFYKDFEDKKIRVIGLNTNDNNQSVFNSDGTYKYGSHDHFAMQQEQLKWLANEALKVPNDYHVIVFGHCPLHETIFDNRECAIKILEAFKLGTTVPIKSVYPDHEVDFTASFINQGPGNLVGYICGHWHDEGFNQIGESIKFTQMRCL
ncbi:BppU family phage baseplate upper protein, partial [Enterococcus wangshanyuanii]